MGRQMGERSSWLVAVRQLGRLQHMLPVVQLPGGLKRPGRSTRRGCCPSRSERSGQRQHDHLRGRPCRGLPRDAALCCLTLSLPLGFGAPIAAVICRRRLKLICAAAGAAGGRPVALLPPLLLLLLLLLLPVALPALAPPLQRPLAGAAGTRELVQRVQHVALKEGNGEMEFRARRRGREGAEGAEE